MKLKVLFVSIFREGDGGGEGRVAFELARWCAQQAAVVMLCPGESTGPSSDESGFHFFHIQSAHQDKFSIPLLNAPTVRRLYHFLDAWQPDVIHIHDPALLGVVAQLWARLNRVPVFYTAHILPSRALEFGPSELASWLSSPLNDTLVEQYLNNFYDNCDAVVGLNAAAVSEIREFGFRGPVFQIPNGRDLQQFGQAAFADPLSPQKTLAFTGFLSRRKNQLYLVEMLAHLPRNYQLWLMGEDLTPGYTEELNRLIRAHDLQVRFTGQLSQAEIAAALAQVHVFVSASKMEVQSLAVIEALASGTPVVGLANQTIEELVDDSNGVCLPKDTSPEAFAAAVQRVCSLPAAEYHQLCHSARQRVQPLDRANIVRQTLQAYQQVLEQRAAAEPAPPAGEMIGRSLAQLPQGLLAPELVEFLSTRLEEALRQPVQHARAVWLTGVNMVGAVIGFYVVQGPLKTYRRLRRLPLRRP